MLVWASIKMCVTFTNFQHSDHAGAIVHCLPQKSSVFHNLSGVKTNRVGHVPKNSAKRNFGRLWYRCIYHFSSPNLEVILQGNSNFGHQTTIHLYKTQKATETPFLSTLLVVSHDLTWSGSRAKHSPLIHYRRRSTGQPATSQRKIAASLVKQPVLVPQRGWKKWLVYCRRKGQHKTARSGLVSRTTQLPLSSSTWQVLLKIVNNHSMSELKIAVVCSSNQNRSMEAHNLLR